MTDQTVLSNTDHRGVTRITLNRADKSNAFNADVMTALINALTNADNSSATRVVVLQGEGKHFSAGADLNYMKATAALSRDENIEDAENLARLMQTLDQLSKPTIARIQGAAFGGALGLICTCDIAVAADNARFCLSEARLGLAPAAIGPYVVRVLGARQARRYFLTTEEIPAHQALTLGLVHEVTDVDTLDDTVDMLVDRLLKNGPVALNACKSLVARAIDNQPDADLIRYTAELIAELRTGPEGQEGLQAFLDKRKPNWTQDSSR